MKTRNGFVSNSSSSSFVVAFPKMPESEKDVLNYMFDGKEGGLSLEYQQDGLSYNQVSNIVFKDIKEGNFKKATKKDVVEVFSGRYHYNPPNHSTFWPGRINDEDGGAWSDRCGRYYGNNKQLMNELKTVITEEEKNSQKLRDEENQIVKNGIGLQPKYAYKGGEDPYTKKPYTAKDIKAYNDYYKKQRNLERQIKGL